MLVRWVLPCSGVIRSGRMAGARVKVGKGVGQRVLVGEGVKVSVGVRVGVGIAVGVSVVVGVMAAVAEGAAVAEAVPATAVPATGIRVAVAVTVKVGSDELPARGRAVSVGTTMSVANGGSVAITEMAAVAVGTPGGAAAVRLNHQPNRASSTTPATMKGVNRRQPERVTRVPCKIPRLCSFTAVPASLPTASFNALARSN